MEALSKATAAAPCGPLQGLPQLLPHEPAVLRRRADGSLSAEPWTLPGSLGSLLAPLGAPPDCSDCLARWEKFAAMRCLSTLDHLVQNSGKQLQDLADKHARCLLQPQGGRLPPSHHAVQCLQQHLIAPSVLAAEQLVSAREQKPPGLCAADEVLRDEPDTVSYRFGRFTQQLVSLMGRAAVSPCLSLEGLSDLWLMVEPCHGELRSKNQKERFRKRASEGPLRCRLKLKVAEPMMLGKQRCVVRLGQHFVEPFVHDFAEGRLLVEWELPELDWLTLLEEDKALSVGLKLSSC